LKLDEAAIEAEAIRNSLADPEGIDRMLAVAGSRRSRAFRNIEDCRANCALISLTEIACPGRHSTRLLTPRPGRPEAAGGEAMTRTSLHPVLKLPGGEPVHIVQYCDQCVTPFPGGVRCKVFNTSSSQRMRCTSWSMVTRPSSRKSRRSGRSGPWRVAAVLIRFIGLLRCQVLLTPQAR
jgi:hypothetical protein